MNRISRFLAPSVRRRVLSSFAVVTLLVLAMALSGYVQLTQVRTFAEQEIPISAQMGALQDFALALSSLDANLERFLVIRGGEFRDSAIQDLADMASAIDALRAAEDQEARPALDEIEKVTAGLHTAALALLDVESTHVTSTEVNQKVISTYSQIDRLKQLHRELAADTLNRLQETAVTQGGIVSNVITQSAMLGSAVLVIAVIVSLLVVRTLRPIGALTDTARAIAAGDLNRSAPAGSQDEIGVLAGAFNSMTTQLRQTLASLEQRVAARTRDLELAADVGRRVSAVRDLDALLAEAVELIRARFDLYHAQIYLADAGGRALTLRAGTGEVGAELVRRAHRLPINTGSINGRAASERHAVIVADTAASGSFKPNPLLPDTRSEVSIPLRVGERVVGVLDLQSRQPGALTEENLPAFEALAGQIAVAIENASLFAETERARAEVEAQARRLTRAGWEDFLNAIERSERLGYSYEHQTLAPLDEPLRNLPEGHTLAVPIVVTGEAVGTLRLESDADRAWTADETTLATVVAAQIARQVENLRLLAQAERYRAEAEAATRRLTREGWKSYLDSAVSAGYVYDLNQVAPQAPADSARGQAPAPNGSGSAPIAHPLRVHDETIGELAIDGVESLNDEAAELVATVAERLSAHIDNLRLFEETERALIQTEQLSRQNELILDSAGEGIFGLDADGNHTFVNPAAAQLLGYTVEELIGKHSHTTWHHTKPDGKPYPSEECPIYRSIYQDRIEQGDEVFIRKDGTRISVAFTATPVREGNRVVGSVVSFLDMTQRKRDQAIIAQRAVQLETVATVSSTASTVLDPDQLLQAVADLTQERFNIYHAHIYLADESWNTLLLAAGAGEVGRQMVGTGHAIPMDAEISLVARATRERKAIIVNDVRSQADFLPNPMLPETRAEMAVPMIVGDKVLGVFDVQSDTAGHFTQEDANIYTTLAAQVGVALQNARLYAQQTATVARLRELDHLKSSFLANMSHELRTPLNSILGFADVMLEGLDGPLTDTMDNDLRLISRNGQHLLSLINDVLDMAKIEAGKMNLNVERFNLREVLEEVLDIAGPLAREKSLQLRLDDGSGRELQLVADRIRLRQVMINLVGNAIKFTETGGVTLGARRDNGHVRISVRDTGIGIPAEQAQVVFEEFRQVDASSTRKAGGTGLGLPISRRLIELHGGRLWVESAGVPGQGSTFLIELPAGESDPPAAPQGQAREPVVESEA